MGLFSILPMLANALPTLFTNRMSEKRYPTTPETITITNHSVYTEKQVVIRGIDRILIDSEAYEVEDGYQIDSAVSSVNDLDKAVAVVAQQTNSAKNDLKLRDSETRLQRLFFGFTAGGVGFAFGDLLTQATLSAAEEAHRGPYLWAGRFIGALLLASPAQAGMKKMREPTTRRLEQKLFDSQELLRRTIGHRDRMAERGM